MARAVEDPVLRRSHPQCGSAVMVCSAGLHTLVPPVYN